jgi:hypothetical protein
MTDEERGLLDYIADNFDTDRIEKDGVFVRTRSSANGKVKTGDIAGFTHYEGYLQISIMGKTYSQHRIVYLWVNKNIPSRQIDHINHIRNDNRPENLRDVSNGVNHKNVKLPKNNTSGYIGVCFLKKSSRWQGQVGLGDKKNRYVRTFKSKQDAIDFVTAKRAELGYHENHGKPKTTEETKCEV